MKTIKIIFSALFLTALLSMMSCSSTTSLPKDDVYYIPGGEPEYTANTGYTKHINNSDKNKYQNYSQGEVVTGENNNNQDEDYQTDDEYYDGDYAARIKRFHESDGSDFDYYDDYYDDNSDNCYCSGSNDPDVSISLGFGMGMGFGVGFGLGWGYPYYGWGYPYYGWGYPYYGYPYYGWGGSYWNGYWNGYWDGYYGGGYYPGGYYPPYPYYPDYGYGYGSVYRPRGNRTGGTNLPRYTSTGGTNAGNSGYKTTVAGTRAQVSADNVAANNLRAGSKEYVNTAVAYRATTDRQKTEPQNVSKRKTKTNVNTTQTADLQKTAA